MNADGCRMTRRLAAGWSDALTSAPMFGRIGARQQAAGLGDVGVCFLAKPIMALHAATPG
jgi:hypothetical protein